MLKGPAAKLDVVLELKDIAQGLKGHKTQINRRKLCSKCKGIGAKSAADIVKCTECNGMGVVVMRRQLGPGMIQQFQTACQKCAGAGTISKSVCGGCGGAKVVVEREDVVFDVPAGCPDGHRIILPGKSDESPKYSQPGDLYIIIHTNPHPRFTRDGPHLYATADPLTLREALLGFKRTFVNADGSKITLERTEPTQPNQVMVLEGKGLPKSGDYLGRRGTLYITLPVILPPTLTKKQRTALEAVLPSEHMSPKEDL